MKKLSLLFVLSIFTFSVGFSQADSLKNKPVIKFEKTEYDFGTITQGSNGTFELFYTNEGVEPLIVTNIIKGCGCTSADWTKEPVKKGKKGSIKVTYNTQIIGAFHKSVNVTSNSLTPAIVITFKGTVIEPAKTSPAAQPASTIENTK